ncbi:hypothetical protein Tco_0472684 [Tanacetum coccineum]
MFVIEQPLPAAPAANSEAQVLLEWNAVYDAYNEVACLILGSMTAELHRQFENSSPYDMIKELKAMFEKQAGVERFDLIQTFHACKQEEGKPVVAYVIQMKGYVDQLEHLGKTMGELHAMLIEYEKGLPKKAKNTTVNDVILKGKDKQVYIPKPKNLKPSAKEHPAKDDAYHHCKENYLLSLTNPGCMTLVVVVIFVLQNRGLEKQGNLNNELSIYNCHYEPSILRGVVSVHRLVENEFIQHFTDFRISVSKNNVHYFNVIPNNGIYEIDMHNLVPNVNSFFNVSTKRAKPNLDSTYLWQCRLAHISKKRVEKLQHERLLKSTDDEYLVYRVR